LIPRTEAELFQRARALAGRTLGSIAAEHGSVPPVELVKAKGWAGQLLERALGASAASRAEPDFQHLGVELKSLPVDARGRPRESTFVCTIALSEIGDVEWESSRVWRKLRRVLWLPIEADRRLLPAERRVGEPLLWSPSAEEESALRFDWEELSGLMGRGAVEAITGHLGKWLQVRPKAANGQARRRALDADGVGFATLPRGFYLRAAFTARLLASHYAIGRP